MLQWEHFNEPSVVTVFLALLLNADRDGKTEISLSGLSIATGLTINTVRSALGKLAGSGEIERNTIDGKKTITTIANWSKYQVYQESSPPTKKGVAKIDTPPCQKLIHPDEGISKIDTPPYQKLIGTLSKIDTPTHIYINKNVEEYNKKEKQKKYAHARGFGEIWDEWFGETQNQTIESLLMHEKSSIEELMDAAESAIIDMSMNGDSENVSNADKKKSLYSLMIYKLRSNKKNGQRTTTGGSGKTNTVTGFKTLNKP